MNKKTLYFSKILIVIILTLFVLIFTRKSNSFKDTFYKKVYDTNFNFGYVNSIYTKFFGSVIPLSNFTKKNEMVFNEKLKYKNYETYLDGVKLTVDDNYVIPALDSGLVTFIGTKDGYGNTITINQVNGIDVCYGNISKYNVNQYDYVEKNSYIGEVNNTLYVVFKKNGEILNYEEYIK